MPPSGAPTGATEPADSELAELAARRDALQQSAGLPGAQLQPILDAAFAELDGAIDALTTLQAQAARKADAPSEQTRAERRLLRAVFAEAPVALFLLERDGTVRRVNNRAGGMIGSSPAYAAGKAFTVFVDLPFRAAVQTQMAAAVRTGGLRQTECGLLGADGVVQAQLTIEPITLPEDAGVLLVAASPHPASATPAAPSPAKTLPAAKTPTPAAPSPAKTLPAAEAPTAAKAPAVPTPATVRPAPRPRPPQPLAAEPASGPPGPRPGEASTATMQSVRTMAQRMDLLTAITRLLLENSTFSESLTMQRCARLLAGEFASWVIVDVIRGRRLRRQVVVGPPGEDSAMTARAVRDADPEPGSLPAQVHETGKSLLQAHSDDTAMLGQGPDGMPLLMQLGATSVLSVPIAEGQRGYGVITLCRGSGEGPFQIADLALAEELGAQLAVAIRVDRLFRRRSEVAEALQASLLPRVLPEVPGIELAAAYMSATEGMDVGGDFYDVYPIPDGWGLTIGDVTGKGEEAVAMTAAARYAIRVIAHWTADPVEVLRQANEVLLSTEGSGRFVTAKTVQLTWRDGLLHVSLGTAGHPGPAVVRSDGRVEMTGGGGLPLGLFPEAQPGLEEIDLAKGDTLFFFTDGLTETRSPDLRYFEERLADELVTLAGRPASEVVAGIQARAEAFSAGQMRDDLTVLALRVLDPPP
jgi:serine phosphatase RsbU (regulator of sigma subunit)/PAS domain-containing protein